MIWILRDGDKEVGIHYDLEELLKISEALEPKEGFSIGFDTDKFRDAHIRETIMFPKM